MENLLESYFVQIDGTFDKLEAIGAPIMVVMNAYDIHNYPHLWLLQST